MDTREAEQVALPEDNEAPIQNQESNLINFTTVHYDPTKDISFQAVPSYGIWRKPNQSEVLIEYLYCLFVGFYSIVINPFSGILLLETFFNSLFWTLALLCTFYRRNFIVNMMSSIMTKIIWAQTFLAIDSVLHSYTGASKSLFLNVSILISNIVIYMGISYSRQLTVKSFDGSTALLVTLFGGFFGMGTRFLFHFVTGSWILVYGILVFLVATCMLPYAMIRRDKDRLVKKMLLSCIVLYVICILSILIYYWTEGPKFAKMFIFMAKNNDPMFILAIVDEIHAGIKKGILDVILKSTLAGNMIPFLAKVVFWLIRWPLIEGIFACIRLVLTARALYYPLYYQVFDYRTFEQITNEAKENTLLQTFNKFTNDVRSKIPRQLLVSDAYAERDAIFALWVMCSVLTGVVVCISIIWIYFKSLRTMHREATLAMLMPAQERMKIDPKTYSKRIVVTKEMMNDLYAKYRLAPKTLTEEQKLLFKIVSSGGVLVQN